MKISKLFCELFLGLFLLAFLAGNALAQKGRPQPPPPPPPPADPAIAYIVGTSWHGDLNVMNADGTNIHTVVAEDRALGNTSPSWSPDGSQLVFVRNDSYQGWIYVVNKDGSDLREVIRIGDISFADPKWSPEPLADGQYKFLFRCQTQGGQGDICAVNADGTGVINLTNTPVDEFYPTWDHTASRFAARVYGERGQADIVVYDIALVDGVLKAVPSMNLTDAGPLKNAVEALPAWAKTQDRIAVGAFSDIWIIDLADPYNPLRVTNTSGYSERNPSWSADDSQIVYARTPLTTSNKEKAGIFVVNVDGSGTKAIAPVANAYRLDWRRCCPTCLKACAP